MDAPEKAIMKKRKEAVSLKIRRIWAVYFSPVAQTGKMVCKIAQAAGKAAGSIPVNVLDWTLPQARQEMLTFDEGDLVVLGVPTYAGRVPNKLLPFVKDFIKGNGAFGAAVVTYGNRSFDDSLMELFSCMEENDFLMLGAAAFVCRHVFSEKLAPERPSGEDFLQAENFGKALVEYTEKNDNPEFLIRSQIPGRNPVGPYYVPKGTDGKPAVFLKAKPKTRKELCDDCGICAAVCPMGCFSGGDFKKAEGICIKCQACIHRCPKGAKYFDDEAFLSHVAMLEEHFADRYPANEICLAGGEK